MVENEIAPSTFTSFPFFHKRLLMFCFSFQTCVISNYLPVSIAYRQCLFTYPYPFYLLSPFPLTSLGLTEERGVK